MKTKNNPNKKLNKLRQQIDWADKVIISALSKRMSVVKKIGEVKKKYKLPIVQKKRWKDVIATRVKAAHKKGLNPRFVGQLLKTIHTEAVRIQKTVKKKGSRS